MMINVRIAYFSVLFFLILVTVVNAQDDESVVYHPADETAELATKGLEVGDRLPEYTFANPLVNYPARQAQLSDFRGKLLILEFWSMGCTSCIAGFPKLQHLQEKFGDRIQILLVNPWSDKSEVMELLERRKQLTGFDLKLPVAFGDRALLDYFPMVGVPHVVWVNQEGTIESVTRSNPVNAVNIQALLDGRVVEMPQASTELLSYEKDLPLFVDGNAGDGRDMLWRSMLSKRINGLTATKRISIPAPDSEQPYSKITVQNFSARSMFQVAYGYQNHPYYYNMLAMLPRSRIAWEVVDTSAYVLSVAGQIRNENTYTYELIAPKDRTEGELLAMMQQDLERYFGLSANWEVRKVKCLVLSAVDSTRFKELKMTNEYPPVWSNENKMEVHIENASPAELAFWMERMIFGNRGLPVVDETGYDGKLVGIHLNGLDQNKWEDWNKYLRPFGLKLDAEYREIDLLVLSNLE